MSEALVVNLFAGPGTGKSTVAAATFAELKQRGLNAELAHEFAKDLTWEERSRALRYQPYIAGKQMWRVHRLLDQTEVVITDSPILLSLIYSGQGGSREFQDFVIATFRAWRTMNLFLVRNPDRAYNPKGRWQTEKEAKLIDSRILGMLSAVDVTFSKLYMPDSVSQIAGTIADLVEIQCLRS